MRHCNALCKQSADNHPVKARPFVPIAHFFGEKLWGLQDNQARIPGKHLRHYAISDVLEPLRPVRQASVRPKFRAGNGYRSSAPGDSCAVKGQV